MILPINPYTTKPAILLALSLLVTAGCGTNYPVVRWTAEEAITREPGKMLVIAVVNDKAARQQWENSLAGSLARHRIYAMASHKLAENIQAVNERKLTEWSQEHTFHSVLVTDIKGMDEEAVLAPAGRYVPVQFYNDLWGYFEDGRFWEGQAGYYESYSKYKLECNLYDAATGRLIWAAAVQTDRADSQDDTIAALQRKIIEHLAAHNLLSTRS